MSAARVLALSSVASLTMRRICSADPAHLPQRSQVSSVDPAHAKIAQVPTVRTRAVIKQAADYQIIKLDRSACKWFDSNTQIVSVPVGQDPTDVLTRFCLTEKGSTVLADIEDRLERLA